MRNVLCLLLVSLSVMLCAGCDKDDNEGLVPTEVLAEFDSMFPKAKHTHWADEELYYKVSFVVERIPKTAWFRPSGEWVMTAGSPYGLVQSVATGSVSATNRSSVLENEGGTAYYTNMIQTDAAINPGNSGGALVDSNGALIGINTMITSSSGSYSGVGFAIPVDYAMGIAQQIIDGKTPSHAQLGVTTATVNSQVAQAYGLSVDAGALITGVSSGGGAEAAGIQEGDVITKVNDTTIESATDLILAVRSVNPGDTAQVELNRNGETQTVTVTLGSDEGTTSNSGSNSGNGSNGYGYGYGGGNGGYGYGFGY